ncbi:MAG: methyltransferase domain-containing protein [Candidatus Heimdallarchaeota archaeon]
MTRKNKLPEFPDSYVGEKSSEYDNSKWMERNQKRTTLSCIQYLFDKKLDLVGKKDFLDKKPYLILDLGCGTGFSSEILIDSGFRVIGIDILLDMIFKAKTKIDYLEKGFNLNLILADIRHLPLRTESIDHVISISAYNFILHGAKYRKEKSRMVNNAVKLLKDILKKNGRLIIELYPNSEEDLILFQSSFINNGFNGFVIKKNPKQTKGQTFLLLKKVVI